MAGDDQDDQEGSPSRTDMQEWQVTCTADMQNGRLEWLEWLGKE